jgi:hypothetical protein
LVITAGNAFVNFNRIGVLPDLTGCKAPFEITLIEESFDWMWEGFAPPFPEQDFFAIGEKDIGDVQ